MYSDPLHCWKHHFLTSLEGRSSIDVGAVGWEIIYHNYNKKKKLKKYRYSFYLIYYLMILKLSAHNPEGVVYEVMIYVDLNIRILLYSVVYLLLLGYKKHDIQFT